MTLSKLLDVALGLVEAGFFFALIIMYAIILGKLIQPTKKIK